MSGRRGVQPTRSANIHLWPIERHLLQGSSVAPSSRHSCLLRHTGPLAAQQQGSVRLDYDRKEGASSCPDGGVVAASVGERLGYEPFDPAAPDTVSVTVLKKDRGLQARIEMLGSDGKSKAER